MSTGQILLASKSLPHTVPRLSQHTGVGQGYRLETVVVAATGTHTNKVQEDEVLENNLQVQEVSTRG